MRRAVNAALAAALALGAAASLAACGGESEPVRIGAGTEPAWTPDGGLVYSAFSDDQRDLFASGRDGGDARRLTTSPAYDMLPAVSPSGAVAYFEGDERGVRLMVRDAPAGESRPVDTHGLNVMLTRPAWAPDGTITVAVARRGEGEVNLMGLDPEGAEPRVVVEEPGYDSHPSWSSDGRLAFVSRRAGSPDIWVLSVAGDTTRLTGHEGAEESPAWSPDGRSIVYVSAREGGRELYVVPASGGDLRRLTSDVGRVHAPAWSPDGRRIAFAIVASGRVDDDLMLLEVRVR